MRAAILALLVCACRISDEHFVVGDGGGDGAMHDAMPDAPPAPLGKAYIADPGSGVLVTGGIFLITKDAQNELLPGGTAVSTTGATVVLVGRDGTQLYALESGGLRLAHYTIQGDGRLTTHMDTLTLAVAAVDLAIDPTGRWIAVANRTDTIVIATLDAAGNLMGQTSTSVTGTKLRRVAFTRDGGCLLATSSGSMLTPHVESLVFAGGALTPHAEVGALANATFVAVHPNRTSAYVSATVPGGGIAVQAYQVSADCMVTTDGIAMPVTDAATDTPAAGLAVDPGGRYLFATGYKVTRITLDAGGGFTIDHGTYLPPTMTPSAGSPGVQVAFDPAVPDRLYAVSPSYQKVSSPGAIGAAIDSGGALTFNSGSYPANPGGLPQSIALAP